MNSCLRIIVCCVVGLGAAAAQPSDAEVKRRLKRGNPKITSIELARSGGTAKRVFENGAWVERYSRSYVIKMRTEYKGITYVLTGEDRYHRLGGRWKYVRSFIQDGRYDGVPNPSAADVLKMANGDLEKTLAGEYSRIVGDLLAPLAIAKTPRWVWHSLTSVSVRLATTYRVKVSSTEVHDVEQLFELRLYRDDMNGPFDRFISAPVGDTVARKVLRKKTYASPSEVDALPKLRTVRAESAARREAAKRPTARVPAFRSPKDAARYVHNLLRTGDLDRFKAGLTPVLARSAYEQGRTVRLGYHTIEMFKKVGYKIANYNAQYCRNLVEPRANDSKVSWKSRNPQMATSISYVREGGRIRIVEVRVGTARPNGSIARGMTDAKCK